MNTIRRQPWPDKYVMLQEPSRPTVGGFEDVLKAAEDEKPLQTFLATHPSFLRLQLPSAQDVWCWDRPRLGAEFIPDFLFCRRDSTGFRWTMVELESPTKPPLLQSGRPSAKLNEALAQVRDWRIWLRDNVSYARSQHGLKGIDGECEAVVVIGRRAHVDPDHALQYRELSRDRISVMSYDRVLDTARAAAR